MLNRKKVKCSQKWKKNEYNDFIQAESSYWWPGERQTLNISRQSIGSLQNKGQIFVVADVFLKTRNILHFYHFNIV